MLNRSLPDAVATAKREALSVRSDEHHRPMKHLLPPLPWAGFSLIELMTVLAIIAIVLALAYPTYLEQVRKSRRADATASLMDRAHSLERCFTRLNAYDNAACPDPAGDSNDGFYTVTVDRTSSAYTLTATPVADQANDPCGIFSMDYLGNKLPLPGSYRCWGS